MLTKIRDAECDGIEPMKSMVRTCVTEQKLHRQLA